MNFTGMRNQPCRITAATREPSLFIMRKARSARRWRIFDSERLHHRLADRPFFPPPPRDNRYREAGQWIGGPILHARPFTPMTAQSPPSAMPWDTIPARHARARQKGDKSISIPKVIHSTPCA
tara:strand:+ start:4425 stop:4793 length:369 start_codon:yes stop_codon:yes gene_type:complete